MMALIRWLSGDNVASHVEVEGQEKCRQNNRIHFRSRKSASDVG